MYGAADQWVDVTDPVNSLLHDSGEATVDNHLAGDPCPGTWKRCVIQFWNGSKVEYQEHETVRLFRLQKTNLIYHVCPFTKGRKQWKWNIRQLKRFASWTTGKRVVSIVTGDGIDPPVQVLREFGDFRIDKLYVRVNSDLWEMETFPYALSQIANTNQNEAFFYCHAKGTSKPADSSELKAARLWAGYMYRFLFSNPSKTLDALNRYSTVGSFKEQVGSFGTNWHFSGTFWGIRHDQLFRKPNWNEYVAQRGFIEYYPSRHFKTHEALDFCPIKRPRDWLHWASWQKAAPRIDQALREFARSRS
jgi:hypothetical protein